MKNVEKIRIKILNVAQSAFGHWGFDKTTMELIAKEAGKSKSTLYYYFKNKDELYAAVVEKEGNYIMNELSKVINTDGSTGEILAKYAKKRFEVTQTVISHYKSVKNDYLKFYPAIQKYRKKYDEFEHFAIKQMLLKGIQNDELNIVQEQVDDVALGISAAIKGLEIPLLIESSKNTTEKKIEILLNLFLHGLLKKQL